MRVSRARNCIRIPEAGGICRAAQAETARQSCQRHPTANGSCAPCEKASLRFWGLLYGSRLTLVLLEALWWTSTFRMCTNKSGHQNGGPPIQVLLLLRFLQQTSLQQESLRRITIYPSKEFGLTRGLKLCLLAGDGQWDLRNEAGGLDSGRLRRRQDAQSSTQVATKGHT